MRQNITAEKFRVKYILLFLIQTAIERSLDIKQEPVKVLVCMDEDDAVCAD